MGDDGVGATNRSAAEGEDGRAGDGSAFRCRIEIEVRYRDLDANAHVNNAVYFTYFEQARIAYFRTLTGGGPLAAGELGVVVAEATTRFRSPALLGEILVVGVRVTSMRHTSFVMEYEVRERETERLVATGSAVMVAYDFERQRVRAIRPEMRRAVELYEGRAFRAAPVAGSGAGTTERRPASGALQEPAH
ncbi:MAG: hypothetical protein NVSMB65_12070 [Chloroflexota bacterium]